MPAFKKFFTHTISALRIAHMVAKGIDYTTLGMYMLNISRLQNVNSLLHEASKCLKDILDYELFGFAIKEDEKMELWVDPRLYREQLLDLVKKDYDSQINDTIIHYFTHGSGNKSPKADIVNLDFVLSYPAVKGKYDARLYILPKKRIISYHGEIISIIASTIGVALENSLKVKELESAAAIDPLTGCYNRRALSGYIEHDVANSLRHALPLSVIIFDIDHFKKVNDCYGHIAGDVVLRSVSALVASTIRKGDYIARYGGEEFLIVLPDTGLESALELAERLRRVVRDLTIDVGEHNVSVTASFGVSLLRPGMKKEQLLKEADDALYRAKDGGRNKVEGGRNKVEGGRNRVMA